MFSIGLEFSLPQLKAMRRAVFGLGLAQVAITTAAAMVALHLVGYGWQAGFALGGALAMSSTAIVSKMLAERMEIASPHGRDIMGILLFQDLAVVAFLIVIPSLGKGGGELMGEIAIATLKAAAALVLILFVGQKPMRAWFHVVARQRSRRALHAERAARHAGARGADRARGVVAGARRLSRRHADRGNRVPLPGRGGHQAVSRRAARPLLRHRRHDARSARRRHALELGARCS